MSIQQRFREESPMTAGMEQGRKGPACAVRRGLPDLTEAIPAFISRCIIGREAVVLQPGAAIRRDRKSGGFPLDGDRSGVSGKSISERYSVVVCTEDQLQP